MNTNASEEKLRWAFAQKHAVITFLLISFAWTWLFWFATIPFRAQNDLLVMAMVMIGGFGPAIGGILTLGLTLDLSPKRMATMVIAAGVIFALMALRYRAGNIPNYGADLDDVQPHIQFLMSRKSRLVALSPHDSSPEALAAFQAAFPDSYHTLRVGETI